MTIDERIEFLVQSGESHDRQIGELISQMSELTGRVGGLTDSISKLVMVSNQDATAISTLARIAESHEKRISQLEGQ